MTAQVEIHVGPMRCGKTQHLLETFKSELHTAGGKHAKARLGQCCWLAPNHAALTDCKARLLAADRRAILQPNLLTFANFAGAIIARSSQPVRSISRIQKRRLLRQLILRALRAGKLEYFRAVAHTPGFVAQVDEFIAELKRTDVWPEAFNQWCQQRLPADQRSRELGQLYSQYQSELHRGSLYDAEGRFWAAREILASDAVAHRCKLIAVSGFNDFTAAQYDILRLLAERSSRMLLTLTFEEDVELAADRALLFAKPKQTLMRLSDLFGDAIVEHHHAKPASEGSLGQLQQQAFGEPAPSSLALLPFDSAEIIAASSELGEVEAIAHRIKQLLTSRQASAHQIVVVSRGGEAISALIDAVFADFGIPYHSEQQPSLECEPLVRTLLSLLRLHQEDWPFATLLETVGNRLITRFDDEASEPALSAQVAMELCIRSAQLPAGRAALLEQLEYRLQSQPNEAPSERKTQVEQALAAFHSLEGALATLPADGSLTEWITAIEQLLTQLGIIAEHKTQSRSLATWKLLRKQLHAIDKVDRWCGMSDSLTLQQMQELIASLAREQRVPPGHDEVGRVRILSAESARKVSAAHLFLAGLNEQAFSISPSTDETRTTNDAADTDADEADSLVEGRDATAARSEGMLLFYELISRPTASLTLSYSALDSKGQPLPASPLLVELQRSVGEGRIPTRVLGLGQTSERSDKPLSRGDFRRQSVGQALEGERRWLAGMISHPNLVHAGSSILSGIGAVGERAHRDEFGKFEGLLTSDNARAALPRRFDSDHLWSPSQLENYAACPFRFFGEHLLHLEPLNELTVSNDARRRGSLLHQVLATIHEQLNEEAVEDSDSADLMRRFLQALDSAVKATPLRGIEQSLREIERREIEAWAPDYADQETSYRNQWKHLDEPPRPAHFEVRFGPETRNSNSEPSDGASTTVPFELDLGQERIRLTGQIDRVDIGRVAGVTVFNIIDYKSGKEVKLKLDKVRSGHQLQLPLYALAAEQLLLADREAVALATGYWNIQGKGFDSKKGGSLQLRELADQTLQTSSDWHDLQPDIVARVQELVSGMRAGHFPVYNDDEHCTRSCTLSTICRVAQIRSLEKVWPPLADEASNSN